jgi:hypothetical protein
MSIGEQPAAAARAIAGIARAMRGSRVEPSISLLLARTPGSPYEVVSSVYPDGPTVSSGGSRGFFSAVKPQPKGTAEGAEIRVICVVCGLLCCPRITRKTQI